MNDIINESEPHDPQSILFPLANHKGFLGKGAVCLKAKQTDHSLPLLPTRAFFVNNVRLAWRILTHSSFPISKQFYWKPDPDLDQNNSGTSANLSCLLALAFTCSSRWPLKNFQVWATGEVDDTGKLNPINLLSHKLKGILSSNTSTQPKLVFAPLANFDDIQSLRQSESFEELEFSEQLSIEQIISLAHRTQVLVIWLAPNDLKLLLKWLNVQIGSDLHRKVTYPLLAFLFFSISFFYLYNQTADEEKLVSKKGVELSIDHKVYVNEKCLDKVSAWKEHKSGSVAKTNDCILIEIRSNQPYYLHMKGGFSGKQLIAKSEKKIDRSPKYVKFKLDANIGEELITILASKQSIDDKMVNKILTYRQTLFGGNPSVGGDALAIEPDLWTFKSFELFRNTIVRKHIINHIN